MDKFSVASGFDGLVSGDDLPAELAEGVDLIKEYMSSPLLGGMARDANPDVGSKSWSVVPASSDPRPRPVSKALRQALLAASPSKALKSKLIICESAVKSKMEFTVGSQSSKDSQISYQGPDGELRYGRIHGILAEPKEEDDEEKHAIGRIFVVVEQYQPLEDDDAANDPYQNHPLIGRHGYNLCRVVYDKFLPQMDVIQAEAIVGHIARCAMDDKDLGMVGGRIVATVQVDRVSHPSLANHQHSSKIPSLS